MAADLSALAEDLLMSGAYDDALTVDARRCGHAPATPQRRSAATPAVQALDQLGESLAMRESVALIGDVDDDRLEAMKAVDRHDRRRQRRGAQVGRRGRGTTTLATDARRERSSSASAPKAVTRLASLVGDDRAGSCSAAARACSGGSARPTRVPLLQPLLRQDDPRVARAGGRRRSA